MCGSIAAAVDRYLELSNFKKDSLKKVATPCIDDHLIPAEDFTTKGHLSASKIVLNVCVGLLNNVQRLLNLFF